MEQTVDKIRIDLIKVASRYCSTIYNVEPEHVIDGSRSVLWYYDEVDNTTFVIHPELVEDTFYPGDRAIIERDMAYVLANFGEDLRPSSVKGVWLEVQAPDGFEPGCKYLVRAEYF